MYFSLANFVYIISNKKDNRC